MYVVWNVDVAAATTVVAERTSPRSFSSNSIAPARTSCHPRIGDVLGARHSAPPTYPRGPTTEASQGQQSDSTRLSVVLPNGWDGTLDSIPRFRKSFSVFFSFLFCIAPRFNRTWHARIISRFGYTQVSARTLTSIITPHHCLLLHPTSLFSFPPSPAKKEEPFHPFTLSPSHTTQHQHQNTTHLLLHCTYLLLVCLLLLRLAIHSFNRDKTLQQETRREQEEKKKKKDNNNNNNHILPVPVKSMSSNGRQIPVLRNRVCQSDARSRRSPVGSLFPLSPFDTPRQLSVWQLVYGIGARTVSPPNVSPFATGLHPTLLLCWALTASAGPKNQNQGNLGQSQIASILK